MYFYMYRSLDMLQQRGRQMDGTHEIVQELSVVNNSLALPVSSKRGAVKRMLISLLIMLVLAGVGGVIGFQAARYVEPLFSTGVRSMGLVWVILTMLLILYGVILEHECGHLLGGRLVGSRFLLLIVGPLMILREQRGIRVRLNKNLGAYGGLAASMPQGDRDIARKMLAMVIGGPGASLLLAMLSGLVAWSGLLPVTASYIFFWTALLAGFSFLATSIPFRMGGYYSDGARFLMLLKGGARVERWCTTVLLNAMLLAGKLPREWNIALLQKATAMPDGTLDDVMGCSFAYYHALDTGDIVGAKQFLERQLAQLNELPSIVRPNFALEAAYFEARYHNNPVAAHRWLEQAKGGIIDRCTRARVEAAVLLAEGKKDEARTRIREGLSSVKDAMYLGSGRIEEMWLRELLGMVG